MADRDPVPSMVVCEECAKELNKNSSCQYLIQLHQPRPETVVETVRNPAASTTAMGTTVLLLWIYNQIIAVRYGLEPMPEYIAVILAGAILDGVRFWMSKKAVVTTEIPPAKVPGK